MYQTIKIVIITVKTGKILFMHACHRCYIFETSLRCNPRPENSLCLHTQKGSSMVSTGATYNVKYSKEIHHSK
jgi:hypothetical protein